MHGKIRWLEWGGLFEAHRWERGRGVEQQSILSGW